MASIFVCTGIACANMSHIVGFGPTKLFVTFSLVRHCAPCVRACVCVGGARVLCISSAQYSGLVRNSSFCLCGDAVGLQARAAVHQSFIRSVCSSLFAVSIWAFLSSTRAAHTNTTSNYTDKYNRNRMIDNVREEKHYEHIDGMYRNNGHPTNNRTEIERMCHIKRIRHL